MSQLSLDDTIVAIATPPGEGALGMVRLSGPRSMAIAETLFRACNGAQLSTVESHTVHLGHVVDDETRVDEVMLTVLRAPRTYTRQDMVEITGHGNMLTLRRMVAVALRAGARLAEPGEFTMRAFLSGRIDLTQGEAVLDVIRARTDTSLRAALDQLDGHLSTALRAIHHALANLVAHVEASIDFPEDDIEFVQAAQCGQRLQRLIIQMDALLATAQTGRILREGATVVICGRPNVGKSSLLNALLKTHRAIVTPIAGTTRDTVEDWCNLQGAPVRVIDTAGITMTDDAVEQQGVERSRRAIRQADLVVLVMDRSRPLVAADHALWEDVRALRNGASGQVVVCMNKSDLPAQLVREKVTRTWSGPIVDISATQGTALEVLERAIVEQLWGGAVTVSDGAQITNMRHGDAVRRAVASCRTARAAIERRDTLECVAMDLRAAMEHVGDALGLHVHEDLLDRIFSQFCIGK